MKAKFVNEYVVLPPKSKEDIMRDLRTLSKGELDKQLIKASEKGLTNIVKWIIDAGADVNTQNQIWWTALMYASFNGHKDVVKLLLDNGADVDAKDTDGWTALMYASTNGYEDIVDLLKKHGAKR